MNEEEAIEQLKNILKNTENILKPLDEETPKEVEAFQKMQLKNYNAIETTLNLIQKQQTEIEQLKNMNSHQDKIINKMALDIAANDSNLCQYIDETIRCKKYAGENKLTCDECIKQYYERKVENGN